MDAGTLQVGTKHPAATLAPFAAATCGLNPCRAHAVTCLSRSDIGRHGNYLPDRLMTQDSGKLSWNVPECFVHIGIADAACPHLHQHLTGSRFWLRNIFDLP